MTWPRTFCPEIEEAPAAELRQMQQRRLLEQVTYCYQHSPFYRAKFDAAGLAPHQIRSLADLPMIPFTDKDELRRCLEVSDPPLGLNQTAPQVDVVRVHASSGSTGKPTYVGLTRQDARDWTETIARAYWTAGIRPDDVMLHCFNYSLFVGGLANHLGCEHMGATMIPIGIGQSQRAVRIAQDLKATAYNGTPSYTKYLAEIVRNELGVGARDLGIRKILTGGEPGGGLPQVRAEIEETWGANVRELYGMVDIHPIIGGECERQEGMHFLLPDLVYPELLHVDTGEPLPWQEGALGEVVYTSLRRQANPILRFRTHDVISVTGMGRCDCGRTGFRFRVVGRTDDMQIVKGVNVYPSAVEAILKEDPRLTGEFAILLRAPGPHDELEITIEHRGAALEGGLKRLAADVAASLSSRLLFRARLTLVPEGRLPRFEHKAKRVYRVYAGEELPLK